MEAVKNPNARQLAEQVGRIMAGTRRLRGLRFANGDIYTWRFDEATHDQMASRLLADGRITEDDLVRRVDRLYYEPDTGYFAR